MCEAAIFRVEFLLRPTPSAIRPMFAGRGRGDCSKHTPMARYPHNIQNPPPRKSVGEWHCQPCRRKGAPYSHAGGEGRTVVASPAPQPRRLTCPQRGVSSSSGAEREGGAGAQRRYGRSIIPVGGATTKISLLYATRKVCIGLYTGSVQRVTQLPRRGCIWAGVVVEKVDATQESGQMV